MAVNVKTGIVVGSYARVFKAKENQSGDLKFSICALIDKSKKADIAMYHKAIKEAFMQGVEKGWWTAAAWKSPKFKKPMRDGDEEIKTGDKKPGIGYENQMFFNASSQGDPESEYFAPPEVTKPLNGKVVPITDQSEFYSGCECRLAVAFFPFNNKSNGVAVGLNAVFKTGDGERLDGRESAQSAFSDFAAESENLPGDTAQISEDSSEPFDN